MSRTTGTQAETLAANNAVGSSYASFTSAQYVGPAASGAGYTPANFFLPAYGISKTLYVKGFGVLSWTSTPNLTLGISANTTQGTYNSSGVIATTGATATATASGTNQPFELDVLITCNVTGASGSFLADGLLKYATAASTQAFIRVSSSSANPNTAASLSTESAYYWEPFATWSASASGNAIQFYNIAVLGIN